MSEPVHTHAPVMQVAPMPHEVPQVPQLLLSVWKSTHAPRHVLGVPVGHMQAPEVHAAPIGHALLQAPQLAASDASVAHVPPQST